MQNVIPLEIIRREMAHVMGATTFEDGQPGKVHAAIRVEPDDLRLSLDAFSTRFLKPAYEAMRPMLAGPVVGMSLEVRSSPEGNLIILRPHQMPPAA